MYMHNNHFHRATAHWQVNNNNNNNIVVGACGGELVEALRYKPEGRGIDFPTASLEFFIDIILSAALRPWG
jgi:hypothetical protein